MSVVTSVTAQNTRSVLGIHDLPHEFVELQIDAVLGDLGADAVKLGMLSNESIVFSVAKMLDDYGMDKIVVDPVMVSTSGVSLSDTGAVKALIRELLPITYIVMPNLPEAEVLTGEKVKSLDDMREAAREIKSLGPKFVLVKGGHLDTSYEAVDVLYDGSEFAEYSVPRIGTENTHGGGCTYSAAVCAYLAKGMSMHEALKEAKRYVTQAISKSFNLGHGRGALNHFWNFE